MKAPHVTLKTPLLFQTRKIEKERLSTLQCVRASGLSACVVKKAFIPVLLLKCYLIFFVGITLNCTQEESCWLELKVNHFKNPRIIKDPANELTTLFQLHLWMYAT